jgi:hypothetical protein
MDALKPIISNWQGVSGKSRSQLGELGFEIVQDGAKHPKLLFHGDERFSVAVPGSPSDSQRGGKNLYSEICKLFF